MDPPLSAAAAAASATTLATTAPAFPTATAAASAAPPGGYPESVESSPRSRHADSWDEPLPQVPGAKLRLMCSYGGHIFPRPHDKSLCYIGGDTRIVVVDRHTSLADLSLRLSRTVLNGRLFTLKYQLPNEDLDSLISVTTDEDLENMIEEYDRTSSLGGAAPKFSRLRLFLFPTKVETATSLGTLIEDSAKSESWFVEALNASSGYLPRGVSADSASVNCLLGLDDEGVHGDKSAGDVGAQIGDDSLLLGNKRVSKNSNQDVHSMPDSPMLETTSSFGSTSSSPSMANLPPIRVHVEDHKVGGLDESFAQMSVSAVPGVAGLVGHKHDEAFVLLSSPPPPLPTSIVTASGAPLNSNAFVGETPNRAVSDDERSDHGVPTGYRKPPSPQMQQKPGELPSPDEISRDNSVISRAKPVMYQESVPVVQRDGRVLLANNPVDPKRDASDPNYRIQMQQQQVQDSGYLMPSQLDQHQHQQFQQQQQFVHAGAHYIHHTTGAVPMSSYYAMQPQQHQHQLDQQHHYPMYFMPVRQTQPYNVSVQSNLSDATGIPSSRPPLPPNPTILTSSAYKEQPVSSVYPSRTPTPPKPEMAASLYRTAASAAPQIVHMTTADQHYANYSHQMHHPPQSVASAAAAAANYSYEFTDPAHSQIYYTQPIAATLPPQYQTITSAAGIPGSEVPVQLPAETAKQQHQIRTSQPI